MLRVVDQLARPGPRRCSPPGAVGWVATVTAGATAKHAAERSSVGAIAGPAPKPPTPGRGGAPGMRGGEENADEESQAV